MKKTFSWSTNLKFIVTFFTLFCLTIKTSDLNENNTALSVMTFNTYCFPEKLTNLLKRLRIIDLASSVTKSVSQRIDEISTFVLKQNPDLVLFQELWNQENKQQMIKKLQQQYPHNFYEQTKYSTKYDKKSIKKYTKKYGRLKKFAINSLETLNPTKMDSGLLIMSKFPIVWKEQINYSHNLDTFLGKGALLIGLNDQHNEPVIVVNTHLQAGNSLKETTVRKKQIQELARALKMAKENHLQFLHAKTIIAGDFNESITYDKTQNRLIDHTPYMVDSFKDNNINVSNNQIIKALSERNDIKDILEINKLKRRSALKTAAGELKEAVVQKNLNAHQHHCGQDYYEQASEKNGKQLLDHFFISKNCNLTNYKVFRKDVLGDNGPKEPYNKKIAISDHAAVMAVIE